MSAVPRLTDGLLTVPCCWATIYGPPEDCTCNDPPGIHERLDAIERRLTKLEGDPGAEHAGTA